MKKLPSSDKEWENFKFPRLPGSLEEPAFPSKNKEKLSEELEKSEKDNVDVKENINCFQNKKSSDFDEEEEINFPELPENFYIKKRTWKYHPNKRAFIHERLSRKINVEDLDMSYKIVRLVSVLHGREDLDVEDLLEALDVASMFHYKLTIQEVINVHSDGKFIVWPEPSFETFELENNQEKTKFSSNNKSFSF